jgi:hypothetical protein
MKRFDPALRFARRPVILDHEEVPFTEILQRPAQSLHHIGRQTM